MNRRSDARRWVIALVSATSIIGTLVVLIVPELIPRPGPVDLTVHPIRPFELVLRTEADEDTDDDVQRQIVSIDAPATEEIPDEADYEDRVNRSVEEEMVAPDPGVPALAAPPRPVVEQTERHQRARDEAADQVETEMVAAIDEPVEAAPSRDEETITRVDDPNDIGPQDPTSRIDLSAFSPTFDSAADFVTVPGAGIDYLDLPQGERTQLNSIENLYWSFWDRMKNQVRPHWRPGGVYRSRDPSGRVFGVEDRHTVLRVILNGNGSVRHLYLERSSDLRFLDREAMRAIRAAEPFNNVPEGLKNERGFLSFRFGFYFEVSSSNFRIRRGDW
jgi:TonB family protein